MLISVFVLLVRFSAVNWFGFVMLVGLCVIAYCGGSGLFVDIQTRLIYRFVIPLCVWI